MLPILYVNGECDTANRCMDNSCGHSVIEFVRIGKSCTVTLKIILVAHVTAIGGIPYRPLILPLP